jgi:hypothetical protein
MCHYENTPLCNAQPEASENSPSTPASNVYVNQYSPSNIKQDTSTKALKIIGDRANILQFSTQYFETIHG